MDSRDFQLLVGLYANARQSYQSLGRRVSLSAPVVRDRLNRLRSKGILQKFMLVIDSSVFDRDDLLLFFDGDFSRKSVLAAFAAPDISWVAWKVAGRVSMDEVRRIMGESAQTHYTLEPPMKYVLCRASSLADVITKTRALEKVQGVQSVTITLNREVLVSTDLRHSLIRDEIKKLEKDR